MSNIIITGANQGIGYYMTERFLSEGHSVGVLDLETGHLQSLKETYGDHLLFYICDIRDNSVVASCVGQIADQFQTIDIAIHNACSCTFAPMESTSEETYKEVFETNYFGALRLAREVVPYMSRQRKGRIIFVSSGVGVMGFYNISPYASSKGAIESLAKCLSIEYQSKGISFHIIHPPITRTKSSEPFPIPSEFKADPKSVGYGLAKNIFSKNFVICHSFMQKVQTRMCYLFSIKMGRTMSSKVMGGFGENK